MLEGRRHDLRMRLEEKLRDIRTAGAPDNEVPGHVEHMEVGVREDIDLTLLQMHSQTLRTIDLALARLELGEYGTCSDCGLDISEARLRALPFAVRCRGCEEARERTRPRHARTMAWFDLA